MPDFPRRMLLIHGAWQGAWVFDTWRPQLARRGWKSQAIDLPGNLSDPRDPLSPEAVSLQLYVSHTLAALLRMDASPTVVVGHGLGGVVASQLAEAAPHLVGALVYVAGTMLPSETGLAELDAGGISSCLQLSDDGLTSTLPAQAARDLLLHDVHAVAPELAEAAIVQLRPQAENGRRAVNQLSDERFGRVPRIYVETLQDRAVPLHVQRRMQQLVPGAHVVSMDCGHMPQLAAPRLLADVVCDALEGVRVSGSA